MTLELLEQACEYISEKRSAILKLEEELKTLKEDPQLKTYLNILRVAKTRMEIDEAPGLRNGYKLPSLYRDADGNISEFSYKPID